MALFASPSSLSLPLSLPSTLASRDMTISLVWRSWYTYLLNHNTALTKTEQAQAANYPFCTIEPNVAKVAVPDSRLDKLFEIQKSEKKLPTKIEFMDIAGLVRPLSIPFPEAVALRISYVCSI